MPLGFEKTCHPFLDIMLFAKLRGPVSLAFFSRASSIAHCFSSFEVASLHGDSSLVERACLSVSRTGGIESTLYRTLCHHQKEKGLS
jgi:hypothetical protein